MKQIFIFSIFLTVAGYIHFSATKQEQGRKGVKDRPSEEFFLAHQYPDEVFDAKAYQRAVKAERDRLAFRSGGPAGFNDTWRMEGPGNIGARVNVVAINPTNENIMYAGFSRGGVFKTTDGGNNWLPIFDQRDQLNISEIELNPNNPNELYVGTGDHNISIGWSLGDGIWKSPDGGNTWQSLGLGQTKIISRIVIDPTNTNNLYAATMGAPWEKNNNRGLYKSTDGGQTWTQSLFVSDSSGVIDVVMDPTNSQILYAASWNRIRSNSVTYVSGQDAKIFKTTNGGNTWTQLTGGLPIGDYGRIGLTISQTNPNLLFASYLNASSDIEDVYKTTDGGVTWTPLDAISNGLDPGIFAGFGWYNGQIRVNPTNNDEIYLLGVDMYRTVDGGQSWALATPPWWTYEVHADKHDLKFAPSGNIILGTDGGIYKSTDGTATWTDIENIPTTQFYRVAYNPHEPTLYYGGAQDNGSSSGNFSTLNSWSRIYGGDGFQMRFHPTDNQTFYTETQNGNIVVSTDGGVSFGDATLGIDGSDRRFWDMPYIISAHDPNVLYTGTYRVYKNSTGTNVNWAAISPDLSDGVVFTQGKHTITAIEESQVSSNTLYAGTGDGNVWRTLDGGINWSPLHQNGLPDRYVSSIYASPTVSTRVFVTHCGYRDGDFIPHVHRSDNNGDTWTDISTNLPQVAVYDLLIIPGTNDNVIFVGTDIGVYGTINGGATWERLGSDMPFIPVFDLEYNPVAMRVIAGTFARSIQSYDISPMVFINKPMENNLSVNIFPNPFASNITIQLEQSFQLGLVKIFDSNGKMVFSQSISAGESSINLASLAKGAYILQVLNEKQISNKKIIKQ